MKVGEIWEWKKDKEHKATIKKITRLSDSDDDFLKCWHPDSYTSKIYEEN